MFLSATRMLDDRSWVVKMTLSFAIGFGIFGWSFFWLGVVGLFSPEVAWVVCGLSVTGLFPLRRHLVPAFSSFRFSNMERLLLIFIAMAIGADFLEALAPPLEADTLAYHFLLPKTFIEQGKLVFVPRALDGAVPLLVQMTYVAVLLLGGGEETALTVWAFLSGWAPGFLLYAFGRRWLARHWALALLLLFQTLPAMLYGAGSGQVEARLALFVLVAAFGLVELKDNPRFGPILMIGLGAGLYAGSKYTGLLFVASAGLSLLLFSGRNWLKNGVIYGLAVLVVGAQWYGWNGYHTGDPVFPVLFSALGLEDGVFWNADYAASMKGYLALRNDQIDWWQRWLAYPIVATLFPATAMEAGRVGLGPYFLMIAPFALIGSWCHRHHFKTASLAPAAVMVVLFYVLWLGFGGIPKVRHLIPVLPVFLVCLALGSVKTIQIWPVFRQPLALAMVLSLAINAGVAGLFARPYAIYAFSSQSREEFLSVFYREHEIVSWLNQRQDLQKILLLHRTIPYYLKHDSYYAFPLVQKKIETRTGKTNASVLYKQIQDNQITHILALEFSSEQAPSDSFYSSLNELSAAKCIRLKKKFSLNLAMSRTLPAFKLIQSKSNVWEVTETMCHKTLLQ